MGRFSVAGKRSRAPIAFDAGSSSPGPVYATHNGGDTAKEEHQQQGTAAGVSTSDRSTKKPASSEALTVSIDPDVLDCAICYEPLALPIFQCSNGHIACSSCCSVMRKCHSCPSSLGPSRCLALEKVLESIRVPCPHAKHGCESIVVYSQRQAHSKSCLYSPCACPLTSCIFEGTLKQLTSHFNLQHRGCAVDISYNLFYQVPLDMSDKFTKILHAEDGILYVLSGTTVLSIGKSLSLTCILPRIQGGQQQYELLVKSGGSSLQMCSSVASVARWTGASPSREFLLVPFEFFDEEGNLGLAVCIHSRKRQEASKDICKL